MGAAMMTERWSTENYSGFLLEAVEDPIGLGPGHRQRALIWDERKRVLSR
jgi:hypothetical protein